jgi:putative flippase GtrA
MSKGLFQLAWRDVFSCFALGITAGIFAWISLRIFPDGFLYGTQWILIVVFPLLCLGALRFSLFLSQWFPFVKRFGKFSIVGSTNFFIDIGVLNILIAFFGFQSGAMFILFKGLSFGLGVVHSYFWNRYWVFESGTSLSWKEFLSFLSVSAASIAIDVAVAFFVVSMSSVSLGVTETFLPTIAAIAGALAAALFSFLGTRFLVFPSKNL